MSTESSRAVKERYRSEHRCIDCGKPLEAGYTHTRCETCRAKNFEYQKRYRSNPENMKRIRREAKLTRDFYRSHGICVCCHKQPASPGHVLCEDCLEKNREYVRKKKSAETQEEREKRLVHERKVRKALIARKKAEGRCIGCGKKALKGQQFCLECLIKKRRWARKQAAKSRKHVKTDFSPGLCVRCNKPALPGFKLCKRHYEATLKGLEIGRPLSPFRLLDKMDIAKAKAKTKARARS